MTNEAATAGPRFRPEFDEKQKQARERKEIGEEKKRKTKSIKREKETEAVAAELPHRAPPKDERVLLSFL